MYTYEQAQKLANAKTKQTGIYYTAAPCRSQKFNGFWLITKRYN